MRFDYLTYEVQPQPETVSSLPTAPASSRTFVFVEDAALLLFRYAKTVAVSLVPLFNGTPMKIRDNKYVLLNISDTIESIFIKDIPNPIIR